MSYGDYLNTQTLQAVRCSISSPAGILHIPCSQERTWSIYMQVVSRARVPDCPNPTPTPAPHQSTGSASPRTECVETAVNWSTSPAVALSKLLTTLKLDQVLRGCMESPLPIKIVRRLVRVVSPAYRGGIQHPERLVLRVWLVWVIAIRDHVFVIATLVPRPRVCGASTWPGGAVWWIPCHFPVHSLVVDLQERLEVLCLNP